MTEISPEEEGQIVENYKGQQVITGEMGQTSYGPSYEVLRAELVEEVTTGFGIFVEAVDATDPSGNPVTGADLYNGIVAVAEVYDVFNLPPDAPINDAQRAGLEASAKYMQESAGGRAVVTYAIQAAMPAFEGVDPNHVITAADVQTAVDAAVKKALEDNKNDSNKKSIAERIAEWVKLIFAVGSTLATITAMIVGGIFLHGVLCSFAKEDSGCFTIDPTSGKEGDKIQCDRTCNGCKGQANGGYENCKACVASSSCPTCQSKLVCETPWGVLAHWIHDVITLPAKLASWWSKNWKWIIIVIAIIVGFVLVGMAWKFVNYVRS